MLHKFVTKSYIFSKIYNMKCSAIRFFTIFVFMEGLVWLYINLLKNILDNKIIYLFNDGKYVGDFTTLKTLKKL